LTAAPASVSEKIAGTCAALGIPFFWMPPGTETEAALEICKQNNVTAIHGYCPVFMLKLPRERWVELP
jgi:predicted CoA-binding protein